MHKKLIDMTFLNDLWDAMGLTSIFGAIMLKVSQLLLNFNWGDNLSIVLLIASIIYVIYKIQNIRLDNKLKRKELEK